MKNSIKNLWLILAQSTAIDMERNTLSVFDILEEVTFQVGGSLGDKTVFPINTTLISLWERKEVGDKFDLKVKIVLRDPKDKILTENEGLLSMGAQHKRTRFRAQFQGMPITVEGQYRYEIISMEPEKTENKDLMASTTVEVKISQQPIKSPITL